MPVLHPTLPSTSENITNFNCSDRFLKQINKSYCTQWMSPHQLRDEQHLARLNFLLIYDPPQHLKPSVDGSCGLGRLCTLPLRLGGLALKHLKKSGTQKLTKYCSRKVNPTLLFVWINDKGNPRSPHRYITFFGKRGKESMVRSWQADI